MFSSYTAGIEEYSVKNKNNSQENLLQFVMIQYQKYLVQLYSTVKEIEVLIYDNERCYKIQDLIDNIDTKQRKDLLFTEGYPSISTVSKFKWQESTP